MKKDIFWLCNYGETRACKVNGYSEGDIGLYKNELEKGWKATHIPTGCAFNNHIYKTKEAALDGAMQSMSRSGFNNYVDEFHRSKAYEEFCQSKYDQTAVGVL